MSGADLRRLIQRATPRVEDVRSPDRTDFIRREHSHLPFREVVDALDALEFSAASFVRQMQEVLAVDGAPAPSDMTAVHAVFLILRTLRVLSPKWPAEVEDEDLMHSRSGLEEGAEQNAEVVAAARAKGAECFQKKDFAAAVAEYSRAIRAWSPGSSDSHTLWANRSAAYLQLGETSAALRDARRCVELAPSWPKGRFREGSCLRQLGRLEEAIAAFAAGQKLEEANKEWDREIEKTEKLLCAQPSSLVQQLVLSLLPDLLPAWIRGNDPLGVLQLQVNEDLAELGMPKWRRIREGAKAAKAQIRYAFLSRKLYLANLAANLQSPPDQVAAANLQGQPLKLAEIAAFFPAEDEERCTFHLDVKGGPGGSMAAVLCSLQVPADLRRFLTSIKEPAVPRGGLEGVLEIQRKSGFPKFLPRLLGFQNFPGELHFPVVDLERDAPGELGS